MKIYVDYEYHCHVNIPGGMYQEVDTNEFDGKCLAFIEGYCYDTSKEYIQIYPWRDYGILSEFQEVAQEEQAKATEEIAAIVEEVYNSDIGVIENV